VISEFCTRVGVSRSSLVSFTSYSLLEACARDELNEVAPRGMAVLDPLKVTISNWPEGTVEEFDAPNFPGDASKGTHKVSLSNVFYIDSSDYRKNADKNFYGLSLGKTVHLKYAYNVTCDKVVEDEKGQVLELIVTVDKTNAAKVKGNIHFVSGKVSLSIYWTLIS
jgi:glutaminyl-tRNA synthetase